MIDLDEIEKAASLSITLDAMQTIVFLTCLNSIGVLYNGISNKLDWYSWIIGVASGCALLYWFIVWREKYGK